MADPEQPQLYLITPSEITLSSFPGTLAEILDAVDVAFTEASVGAGISTVLFISTLALTTRIEKKPAHKPILPLFKSGKTRTFA